MNCALVLLFFFMARRSPSSVMIVGVVEEQEKYQDIGRISSNVLLAFSCHEYHRVLAQSRSWICAVRRCKHHVRSLLPRMLFSLYGAASLFVSLLSRREQALFPVQIIIISRTAGWFASMILVMEWRLTSFPFEPDSRQKRHEWGFRHCSRLTASRFASVPWIICALSQRFAVDAFVLGTLAFLFKISE